MKKKRLKFLPFAIEMVVLKWSLVNRYHGTLRVNPSRPNHFLTMDIFNELSHFDIFLHMDVLEFFNFNHT